MAAQRSSVQPLELPLDRFEQFAMGACVDLAAQDLLRARDGERGDALAQFFSRARHFLINFGLGGGEFSVTFLFRLLPSVVDELLATLFSLREDLGRASACLL